MVRNKNNGNLQISFRLINEKQTNPRFLSAGQNLVSHYQLTKITLKAKNIYFLKTKIFSRIWIFQKRESII